MVHIKQLIPQADVSEVVAKRPSLLCMEVRHLVLFRVASAKPNVCRYISCILLAVLFMQNDDMPYKCAAVVFTPLT